MSLAVLPASTKTPLYYHLHQPGEIESLRHPVPLQVYMQEIKQGLTLHVPIAQFILVLHSYPSTKQN